MSDIVDATGTAVPQVRSDQLAGRDRENAERRSEIIRTRMSSRGALGLPRLLDERRLEYGITDKAFAVAQASFDRVYVWQIAMQKGDKFEADSLIHMPESVQQREKAKAPCGIIISAGLTALDHLNSHGIDVGHKVLFCHAAPYHIRYDTVLGLEQHLIVLLAGDIIGSEDLATNLKNRSVRYLAKRNEQGAVEHRFIDERGESWLPDGNVYGEHE